jgi:hypothetical protein
MKGFGFPPGQPNGPQPPKGNTSTYRVDTSQQKAELIAVLKNSEQLWNEKKTK